MSSRMRGLAAAALVTVVSAALVPVAEAAAGLVALPIQLSPMQPATGDEVGPVTLTVRNAGDALAPSCSAVLGVSGLYAPDLACPGAAGLTRLPVAAGAPGKAWRWTLPALAPGAAATFVFTPVTPPASAMFPIVLRWQPSAYAFLFLVDGGASAVRCVGPAPTGRAWPVTDVRSALGALVASPADGEPRHDRRDRQGWHHRPRPHRDEVGGSSPPFRATTTPAHRL